MTEFQLQPEAFLRAAKDFDPAAGEIHQAVDQAASGSAGFATAWGGDAMGASFAANYTTMREQFLDQARDNANKLSQYGEVFTDTHDHYVGTDSTNGELFEGIHTDVPGRVGKAD